MDLSNKNGQPSMEEILASIRRIIAEEPTAANPVIDLHAKYRGKADDQDESNDFELPSIFRPAMPTPERQPLFGRLTDAIRNASGGTGADGKPQKTGEAPERYRGALRDAGNILALSNSQDAPTSGEDGRYRGALRDSGANNNLSSALSSLKLTRGAEPAPAETGIEAEQQPVQPAVLQEPASVIPLQPTAAPAPQVAPAPAPAAPVFSQTPNVAANAPSVEDVRRVMVPFRDMRMARMSGVSTAATSGNVSESPSLETLLQASPAEAAAPLSQEFSNAFAASMPPIPAPPQSFGDALSLDDMHRFASVVEQPRVPPPPPAAAPVETSSATSGIEDTTADLLRPMLRQWLAENMPRMVEKALSIELAQSVKSTRKFEGY